jgi:hypothetical protein
MTNDKSSMTNSQFRPGVLVAAGRAALFAPFAAIPSGWSVVHLTAWEVTARLPINPVLIARAAAPVYFMEDDGLQP